MMSPFLWILQILLAFHTAIGAVWKFSNSEKTVSSSKVIPHTLWRTMGIFELFCSIALILPLFNKRLAILIPVAASFVAVEMVLFSVVDIFSNLTDYDHLIYWLVVATISMFIAYGRVELAPLTRNEV